MRGWELSHSLASLLAPNSPAVFSAFFPSFLCVAGVKGCPPRSIIASFNLVASPLLTHFVTQSVFWLGLSSRDASDGAPALENVMAVVESGARKRTSMGVE